MLLPQESVTLYVLVITSGQEFPSLTSLTNATVGVPQLSASSVTTLMSTAGTSSIHSTFTATGLLAVGSVISLTVIVCVTLMEFPQLSVTEYVLVITSGQEFPSDTSLTNATTGVPQLSASSVTTEISAAGRSGVSNSRGRTSSSGRRGYSRESRIHPEAIRYSRGVGATFVHRGREEAGEARRQSPSAHRMRGSPKAAPGLPDRPGAGDGKGSG